MGDNEIIRALETLLELVLVEGCLQRAKAISKALGLINRQKAEIERLKATVDSFTDIGKLYSEIKKEL